MNFKRKACVDDDMDDKIDDTIEGWPRQQATHATLSGYVRKFGQSAPISDAKVGPHIAEAS